VIRYEIQVRNIGGPAFSAGITSELPQGG